MIGANNADLLSQMVTNNKNKDSLILEKITVQKEREIKQVVEKNQPDLDVYLRDDNKPVELIQIDNLSFKERRSKRLAELNRKLNMK